MITNVASSNPTDCNVIDGAITITATGTGSLQYSIDGGTNWQLNNTFSGLAAGTYNVFVRNTKGVELDNENPTPHIHTTIHISILLITILCRMDEGD